MQEGIPLHRCAKLILHKPGILLVSSEYQLGDTRDVYNLTFLAPRATLLPFPPVFLNLAA